MVDVVPFLGVVEVDADVEIEVDAEVHIKVSEYEGMLADATSTSNGSALTIAELLEFDD